MSKEQLWDNFTKSGKIEDYMKYKEIKNEDGEKIEEINEINKGQGNCN